MARQGSELGGQIEAYRAQSERVFRLKPARRLSLRGVRRWLGRDPRDRELADDRV